MSAEDFRLPFPIDDQELELLEIIRSQGVVLASEGRDLFARLKLLEERFLVKSVFCGAAQGVTQFELTSQGYEVLE